jgi:hypothetical protein
MGRALPVLVVAAAVWAATATAAVAPLFDRTRARVGERVRIDVGYAPIPRQILLYLIPLRLAPKYVSGGSGLPRPAPGPPPADPHLLPLSSPRADPSGLPGSARLFFRVPRVAAGRYTIVVWCKPCGNDHWAMATPSFVQNPRAILRVIR